MCLSKSITSFGSPSEKIISNNKIDTINRPTFWKIGFVISILVTLGLLIATTLAAVECIPLSVQSIPFKILAGITGVLGGVQFLCIIGIIRVYYFSKKNVSPNLTRIDHTKNFQTHTNQAHQLTKKEADLQMIKRLAQQSLYIAFYIKGPTQFLGNFADCAHGISIYGQKFSCAEAAFQWKKYQLGASENGSNALSDPLMQELFTCNGERAFQISRLLKYSVPRQWHKGQKEQIMWEILHAKFKQNSDFAESLAATGNVYLQEHNDRIGKDSDWSDNHDGSGKNKLGRMLMAIRDNQPCPPPSPSQEEQQKIKNNAQDANLRNLSKTI